jgi:hypothetical protein
MCVCVCVSYCFLGTSLMKLSLPLLPPPPAPRLTQTTKLSSRVYGDDWLKMQGGFNTCRGGCVRAFPKVNRILNILSFFFILMMAMTLWMFNTCRDALNVFSQDVLYGTLSAWMIFVCFQYATLCFAGSYLRAKFPEDMPFREPPAPIDRGPNAPVCCCCAMCLCSCCSCCCNMRKLQNASIKFRLCCQGIQICLNKWGGP